MIKRCTCKHKGQDKLHGRGRRVFNKTYDGRNAARATNAGRCTVCGNTK